MARPSGGNNDTLPPSISEMFPASVNVIGASETFSATVSDGDDGSGVRSVSFVIQYPDGITKAFQATEDANILDKWSVTLLGFSNGYWSWWVEARDNAKKGGNRKTSETVNFEVDTTSDGSGGGGGSTGDGTVTNDLWNIVGAVKTATGRIYFEMPRNAKWNGPWIGYVC